MSHISSRGVTSLTWSPRLPPPRSKFSSLPVCQTVTRTAYRYLNFCLLLLAGGLQAACQALLAERFAYWLSRLPTEHVSLTLTNQVTNLLANITIKCVKFTTIIILNNILKRYELLKYFVKSKLILITK